MRLILVRVFILIENICNIYAGCWESDQNNGVGFRCHGDRYYRLFEDDEERLHPILRLPVLVTSYREEWLSTKGKGTITQKACSESST